MCCDCKKSFMQRIMGLLEGNQNATMVEQCSPNVLHLEAAAREVFTAQTWTNNYYMGHNHPFEDIFELSRLLSYSLSSSGQKASQVASDQSTARTPPLLPSPSEVLDQAPSWSRDEANWLGDEPTIDCSSITQESNGSVDPQGSSGLPCFDLPYLLDSPFLCMPPAQPALGDGELSSQPCLVQQAEAPPSFSLPQDSLALDFPLSQDTATAVCHGMRGAAEGTRTSHLPNEFCHTTCSRKDVSDFKIVKKIQVSQRFEEKRYHLSIADSKRIRLKVSKVQKTNQGEASEFHGDTGEEGMNHEDLNLFSQEANNTMVSHTIEKVIDHPVVATEQADADETLKNCIALDLQDIAAMESLKEMHCAAPKLSTSESDLASTDVTALSFNDELHLSTSLSALSTNHSPYPGSKELLINQSSNHQIVPHHHHHHQALDMAPPNGHFPYTSAPDPTLYNKDLSLFCMSSSSHMMNLSHSSFPVEAASLTPYLFSPDILSEDNRVHDHTAHQTCYLPYMKEQETMTQSSNHCPFLLTRASFSQHDLNSLHWRSPAAKTRAARKRRMARKFRHVVPYQARTSLKTSTSSLTWSPVFSRNDNQINRYHSQERELAHTKKNEGQRKCPETNLRFLLQKELKPSDVGTLGRIVLPKKDAEANLPKLNEREGICLPMEDVTDSRVWTLRFRYWPNNKSRMYLLENTRDFITSHRLQEGDFMILYKDDSMGKYMIRAKKVAEIDSTPTTSCGQGTLRWKALHTVKANKENSLPKDSEMEENLDESLLQDLVQGLEEGPRLENDDLPPLDQVYETDDMPIEDLFGLREQIKGL